MIVKNESAVIGRLLDSVSGHITSWRIIDTGSTDGTQDIIRGALAGIPGELRESEWVDFGTNRTELVEWATTVTNGWLLLADADMTFDFKPEFIDELANFDCDQALLAYTGDLAYRQPLLVRAGVAWKYVGRTHEFITADSGYTRASFDALVITHEADGGSRGDKFERDIELLTKDAEDDPSNPRPVFYLAQSHRDMGNILNAEHYYRLRSEMGGWDEEVFYAKYQQGLMQNLLGMEGAIRTLEEAWELRPARAEPAYQLARLNRLERKHRLAWLWARIAVETPQPEDVLFVETDVYQWGALFEYADAAWRMGYTPIILDAAEDLLDQPGLPDDHREHIKYILDDIDKNLGAM